MNILDIAPVVPVVALDDPDRAVPLARALLDGGVGIVEITLRTNAALPAIEAIAAEVPELVVGAGTLVTALQVEAAVAAGAQFLVSPGATPNLLDALAGTGLPYLPGVATISEILTALDRGITEMKFFPAESCGGTTALRSFAGPLPQVRFCPTGGITPSTACDYLALPNVGCVGGTWLTPAAALAAGDWSGIREAAAATTALRHAAPAHR